MSRETGDEFGSVDVASGTTSRTGFVFSYVVCRKVRNV